MSKRNAVTAAATWMNRLYDTIVEQAVSFSTGLEAVVKATEIVRAAVKAEFAAIAKGDSQPIDTAEYTEYLERVAAGFTAARGGNWATLTDKEQQYRRDHIGRLDNYGWQLMRLNPRPKIQERVAKFDKAEKSGKGKGKGRGKGKGKGKRGDNAIAPIVLAAVRGAMKRKISNKRIVMAIDKLRK